MAKTEDTYIGDGSTTSYQFTFPYIKEADVKVSKDDVVLDLTTHYTQATTSITFLTAPALDAAIRIYRDTDTAGLAATFYPGSAIRSADLNDNFTQNLYVTQEVETTAATIDNKLNKSGDTMTGNLIMGEDQTIIFEGATDNTNETTLTVADPTADRTITLPNVTGNVVTTGDTGTVTATMMATDSVDSDELVDGSVDLAHMSDESVDSDQYVDGSIDLIHMSANSVDSAQYVDGSIDKVHLAADIVDGTKIEDNSIDSEHYVDGSIDKVHLATDIVDGTKIADNTIDSEHYVDGSIDHVHLANDIIDGDNIQDDVIDSEHYVAASIDNEHLANDAVDTDEIANEAVTFAKLATADVDISTETWSDSDTKIATTKAIDGRIITLVDDVGGFYAIADETSFPDTNPDINDPPGAGTIVSIKALAGNLVSDGNGEATIANGNVANNATVTIEGLANSTTYIAGNGMLVETSATLHTYTFHRELASAANITSVANNIANVNIVAGDLTYAEDLGLITESLTTGTGNDISTVADNINAINSFSDVYRVASTAPSSSVDEGDLWYDSTANILKYYNNSSWASIVTGMTSLIEDQTPELYAALDCNDKDLTEVGTVSGTNLQIDFGTL